MTTGMQWRGCLLVHAITEGLITRRMLHAWRHVLFNATRPNVMAQLDTGYKVKPQVFSNGHIQVRQLRDDKQKELAEAVRTVQRDAKADDRMHRNIVTANEIEQQYSCLISAEFMHDEDRRRTSEDGELSLLLHISWTPESAQSAKQSRNMARTARTRNAGKAIHGNHIVRMTIRYDYRSLTKARTLHDRTPPATSQQVQKEGDTSERLQ